MTNIEIRWHGHSYFTVKHEGYTIALDPHDGGSLNLPETRVAADAVLVTHNHYDHNAVEMVTTKRVVKWRRGEFELGPLLVRGLPSYHDKSRGQLRGDNTIYIVDASGLKLAHLGDIGHLPGEDLLEKLRGMHIIMIPVGGVYTIDAHEAWELIQLVEPPLVIPMHFWTPYSTLPLDPLDRFLSISKARRLRLENRLLKITRDELPEKTTVVVMPPPVT
ncbi:MAG: MBL fold metallo-hydrolase [Desulfurococcales archaeon]|nr:MBL fold metallo-hydrolase [Desulfurococcales archaeon]